MSAVAGGGGGQIGGKKGPRVGGGGKRGDMRQVPLRLWPPGDVGLLFSWLQSKSKREGKLIVPPRQPHQTLQMNFNKRQRCPAGTADGKVWL